MSGNLASSVRKRSSSLGSQGCHNYDQSQVLTDGGVVLDVYQTIHDPLMEDVDQFTLKYDGKGTSSSKGKKDVAGI
ncbi:hypothetical protein SLA2020_010020 [Shorea laevis]